MLSPATGNVQAPGHPTWHWGIFVVLFGAWILFLFQPRLTMYLGGLLYLVFAAAIGWSALHYRSRGWMLGLLFALLMAAIPVLSTMGAFLAQFLGS